MNRRSFLQVAVAATAGSLAPFARSQDKFPGRPITLVVPFAAGGGGDVVARTVAKGLSDRVGQSVIVDNRVGAGGNIGAAYVLKSPPTGYTLLSMSLTYAIQAAVSKLPFDPVSDLQPIMMVSRDPGLVVVHPSSPFRTAKDLAQAAKAAPGKYTYGSAGTGSIAHLAMEELASVMGVQLVHVPYKGSSQAFSDLLGQQVDMILTSTTFAAPYIKTNRVRALGLSAKERSRTLPDVPTFAEQGYDFQLLDWKAIGGPKGMPADIVAYLNRELNETLKSKAVAEKFEAEGTTAVGGTPEQMMQTIRDEIVRWQRVAQKANVRIE